MQDGFAPHPVEWTETKIANFWNYLGKNPAAREGYFGYQAGRAVIAETKKYIALRGSVLDYGCGPGWFIEHLLGQGIACQGIDFSEESVRAVNDRLKMHSLFRGATLVQELPSSLPGASFDFVFCMETLEHLLPAQLTPTLMELYRVVRPGGHVVVTVPNEEHLEVGKDICPDCGCIFHRVQHVQSFTVSTLSGLMKEHGFQPLVCKPTFFNNQSALVRSLRAGINTLRGAILPNLFYIGRKQLD